jgi:cytochrome c
MDKFPNLLATLLPGGKIIVGGLIRVAKAAAKRLINERYDTAVEAGSAGGVLKAMSSFEFNKIAGGILGTLLFAQVVYLASNALFSHPAPPKPTGVGAEGGKPAAPAAAAPAELLASYIGKADAKKGEDDTKPCQICHNFAKGGGVILGPPLYGVVGRPRASIAGFQYSDAMKAKGGTWTPQDVFTFIKDPQAFVPGTKMTFAGEPDPQKRANIVAYLDTLSDHPVALPAPAAH